MTAYDWPSNVWRGVIDLARETKHRLFNGGEIYDRDKTLRKFKGMDWNYTFGFYLPGVQSHSSGRVFKGFDKRSNKTVWGKIMTTHARGFDDACNTFLLGCSHTETRPCGPKVLGIYKVDETFVVVVTEDAFDTIKRVYPDLHLRPGFGDFALPEAATREFYPMKGGIEKKYAEYSKQCELFEVDAYHRTYVETFTDQHAGNLMRYYNPSTGDVRFMQIDVESDGRFVPTVMSEYAHYLLMHNGSMSINVAYAPDDTILNLKTKIGNILALRTPGGKKIPTEQQTLRTRSGMEYTNDAKVAVVAKNMCFYGGDPTGVTFVLSMGTEKIMLVSAYPPLYRGRSNKDKINKPEVIIDSQLKTNYDRFVTLYGHLYPHVAQFINPTPERSAGIEQNVTTERETQVEPGAVDDGTIMQRLRDTVKQLHDTVNAIDLADAANLSGL